MEDPSTTICSLTLVIGLNLEDLWVPVGLGISAVATGLLGSSIAESVAESHRRKTVDME